VAKKSDIERLFAGTKKEFGTVDILVNNAGVYEFGPLEQITEEHFHRQFNLNVLGLLLTTQEAVKHFPAAGGSVINISSLVSTLGPANASVYSATKGAVDTLTISLAKELGARKIRVNAVRPGLVETEGTVASGFTEGEFHDQYVKNAPLGRIGQPQDVAAAVGYLASDDSSWVTGETLLVSGGHR
jgi:3-oxoacyl-[acyl-carrier protein] reductase